VLFDQAVLTLGARIEEPAAFVGRLNDLLVFLSAESPGAGPPDAGPPDAESPDAGPPDAGDRGATPTAEPGPDPEP
jgi:molecular chaperone HtpG